MTGFRKIIKQIAMNRADPKTPTTVPVLPVNIDLTDNLSKEERKVPPTNIYILNCKIDRNLFIISVFSLLLFNY